MPLIWGIPVSHDYRSLPGGHDKSNHKNKKERGTADGRYEPDGTELNQGWGVCGFTSSFYSLYEQNPGKRAKLIGVGIATKVLAEIKTYLNTLKTGEFQLLSDIEEFTKSFEGFSNFTIDAYIERITEVGVELGKSGDVTSKADDDRIRSNQSFSIAMPPAAVADYLIRIWNACRSHRRHR